MEAGWLSSSFLISVENGDETMEPIEGAAALLRMDSSRGLFDEEHMGEVYGMNLT